MSKVFQIVTDKILAMIDKGVAPWTKPWKASDTARNYEGRVYNGMNALMLSFIAQSNGWAVPAYLTFNQIKKLNGRIKAGQEKLHTAVYFWKWLKKEDENGRESSFPMLRFFLVWNISQVDGIETPKWARDTTNNVVNPIEACDALVAGYVDGPTIKFGGGRACYNPALDTVMMPERNTFHNDVAFYSTFFHELAHSTGHKSRLNRKEINDTISFGSHDYSLEELVAELSACFLCVETGIANDRLTENSAAYLAGWYRALKNDPKMFVMASARAQKAATRIIGEKTAEEEMEEAA